MNKARDGFIPFTKQEMKDRERAFKHMREMFRANKIRILEDLENEYKRFISR